MIVSRISHNKFLVNKTTVLIFHEAALKGLSVLFRNHDKIIGEIDLVKEGYHESNGKFHSNA